jgi:superfamily II DNA helicase RecQ
MVEKMLKIFTLKFNEKIEGFNDEIIYNFLCNKEVISWKSYFFERRNDKFWTIVLEYKHAASQSEAVPGKTREKRDETYKDLLSENDWPLFKRLREWRGETSKAEGIPPYIICDNIQLAKIAVTRPKSLNALQEIKGIGNAKREKYGNDILKLVGIFETPDSAMKGEKING